MFSSLIIRHYAAYLQMSLGVLITLDTAVRTSETLDSFNVKAVNGNRNDPWIAAVQPLQVSFAAVYRGNNSPDLAREPAVH